MTNKILAVFAVALLLGGCKPDDPLKKLQGEWQVEKAVREGKETPADVAKKMTLKVEGDTFTVAEGDNAREEKAKVSIDASKKPAEIDIKPTREANTLMMGIYKLEGDTLTMCWSKKGERPTEFVSKEGTEQMLLVLKRAKK